uniref:Uncharacterized protein n=1 Tax=Anguilla anguilla TaxID=7936 RepID=A0A0E9V202_ANGAN
MSTKTLFSLGVVLIVLVTIVAGGLSSGSGIKHTAMTCLRRLS